MRWVLREGNRIQIRAFGRAGFIRSVVCAAERLSSELRDSLVILVVFPAIPTIPYSRGPKTLTCLGRTQSILLEFQGSLSFNDVSRCESSTLARHIKAAMSRKS